MIRALIFDCFGVVMDINGVYRNEAMLEYILDARKTHKTALLSNISSEGLLRRLPQNDLDTYFDVAIASEAVGLAKPDPRIFELTADRLGVDPSECVMIDDREDHCAGAKAAGMATIQYHDFDQCSRAITGLLLAS